MTTQQSPINKITNEIYSDIYASLDNRNFINEKPVIYHYTSLESLHSILASRSFHCSHCSYTNDYFEFESGLDTIFEATKAINIDDKEGLKALENHLTILKGIKKSGNVYIGAFTSLKDSLSQWRAYSLNATGVAIGLDVKKLTEYCTKNELLFGSVVYSDDFTKNLPKLFKALNPIFSLINDNSTDQDYKNVSLMISTHLLCTTSFIKHFGYKEESEIRIIAGRGVVKNKLSKGLYIPYSELDFRECFHELVKEVWVGPAANQELVKRSVELMLTESDLTNKCEVKLSQIPFRLLTGN